MPEREPLWRRLLPSSLQGRIVGVMALSVAMAQVAGTLLWARQIRSVAIQEALIAADGIATNAAGTLRYFQDLPRPYRPILIEQQRAMGGARFFMNVNAEVIAVEPIAPSDLADAVTQHVSDKLRRLMPQALAVQAHFAWPKGLRIDAEGTRLDELPRAWVESNLMISPRPAPILVIQAEFEAGAWLLLATAMPDPYFLDAEQPVTTNVAWLQLFTLVMVMVLTALLVRNLIRPFNRLAHAANAFGQGANLEHVPEVGSAEVRRTAHAFNAMQERIQRYVMDRERLFIDISHSLKTPITRLKLRTELLDDDQLRQDYHDDLDELDLMVKSALQSVRDADIHENKEPLSLDLMLMRLAKRPIYPQAKINLSMRPCRVMAKPLALRRALGNLLDNAILYGKRVDVTLQPEGDRAVIELRDHGPGIPAAAMSSVFEPRVRLSHGQRENLSGTGLGLGIARAIIEAHGGRLSLSNHPKGGLVVRIELPHRVN